MIRHLYSFFVDSILSFCNKNNNKKTANNLDTDSQENDENHQDVIDKN